MKAQLSIEFLLLLILSLAILFISISVLNSFRETFLLIEKKHLCYSLSKTLEKEVKDICALGDGYSQGIYAPCDFQLVCYGNEWNITCKDNSTYSFSYTFTTDCVCSDAKLKRGNVIIQNVNGRIILSN